MFLLIYFRNSYATRLIETLAMNCFTYSFNNVSCFVQKLALGYTSDPFEYSYSSKEVILYSLSVGVSTQDEDGLQYLYEGHSNFAPLASFGTVPGFGGLTQLITGSIPGVNIELSKVNYLNIIQSLMQAVKNLMLNNIYINKRKNRNLNSYGKKLC